ncbi:WG repeat-containing protein [Cohnella phaseoli]|uniref:WG repeat protein n=1 Tax=Cohnella phaseoli TaxID=456490 RepID=A0A3D9INZ5_9BACL|nr:WG repeat-containing protein [Cohnella phaseoli]RED63492.1 WG repeat protein [Cohnella phaseoli]
MLRRMAGIAGLAVILFGVAGTGHGQGQAIAAEADVAWKSATDQVYLIEEQGKYGFINGRGEIVLEPVNDSLVYNTQTGGSVYYVEDGAARKQTYFDLTGKKLFECAFRACGIPSDGLALYMEKVQTADGTAATRYGYIDMQGKIAVQPIYHKAFNFSEGLARVNQGKASGYIDTKGKLVTPYRFSQTSDFSEGMAAVSLTVGGKYGYIDTSGKLVIPPRFDYATPFSDGAAVVSVNGKYGYIDKTGKYIQKPQFTMAQPFSEGLAFVERNGGRFYINKKGEKVIQNITAGGLFSGGLAPASRRYTYGYINKSGTFVIKDQFEWGNSFKGDLAEVYLPSSESPGYVRGFIDRSGTIVWPHDYKIGQ